MLRNAQANILTHTCSCIHVCTTHMYKYVGSISEIAFIPTNAFGVKHKDAKRVWSTAGEISPTK